MKTSLVQRVHSSEKESGAALVIILAFLVLLTGIVAIFLSRAVIEQKVSSSSANQTRANMLARSAIDMITADLKQEIATNIYSTNTVVGPATNQTTLYFPVTATNMEPLRSGNPAFVAGVDPIPNLIRRSVRSDTLVIPSRASAVNSTTDASYNGRSVSLARWNSHYLIPRLNAGSPNIDSTPVANFTAPDWVMVTTSGPKVITTPDQTTIGRYAYAIYDEGGLLDANVAGFPSSMTSYMTNQIGGKGSLALADLTALSDTNATPLWTVAGTNIDDLVGWRNYATIQPASGSFGNFNFTSDTGSGTNYYNYVSTTTNGFLTVNPNAYYNNQTDQAFTTRQALLKFQRATGFPQDALQYLGTFSRDLEQPSFVPDPNLSNPALAGIAAAKRSKNLLYPIDSSANGNDTYDPTGATQDLINPSLLTARDPTGQLIMKRRFPLSRLALLVTATNTLQAGGTITTAQANQIYDYFGLTWGQPSTSAVAFAGGLTFPGWTYSHGNSATIYELSQIPPLTTPASANPDGTTREPDFFETLKAVINCDSLGKQEGFLQVGTAAHSSTGPYIDGQIHNQLIQIGANLINQYDANSYPICIFFNGLPYYGVANLPYLYGWQQMWYRMRALTPGTDYVTTVGTPPASGTTYETEVMIQPILWNPHAPNSNLIPSTSVPINFRVTACDPTNVAVISPFHPEAGNAWWATGLPTSFPVTQAYHDANNMLATPWKPTISLYTFPQPVISPNSSFITFNTGSPSANFLEPYRLRAPNAPPGSNTASTSTDSNYPATITPNDPNLTAADGGFSTFLGFNCGKVWTGPSVDQANDQNWLSVGTINHDIRLILQYEMPGTTTWYTYDVIDDVYNASGNINTVDNTDVYPYLRAFRTGFRADPRTDRWGEFAMAIFPSTSPTALPVGLTPVELPGNNGVDGGYGNNTICPHYYLPQGITAMPNLNSTYYGVGGALGLAAAPGWGDSLESPSDLMVNVPRTSSNPNMGTKATGTVPTPTAQRPPGGKFFYSDPDGVFRRASGWNFDANGDGLSLYTANGNYNSRPVILNRPFESVAEMGYAFRDEAWRNLDFFTPESGDAALLDAFCLNELQNAPTDASVAGRVNLNTRQPKVLQALIQGVSKAEGGIISNTEAANAAQALVNWTTNTTLTATSPYPAAGILLQGPLRNRSELVGKFVYQVPFTPVLSLSGGQTPVLDGTKSYQGFSSMLNSPPPGIFSSTTDAAIKRRCESIMRALVDSGNTRTWNLLIDVVAQTGRYPAGATALSQFIVTGETRYWVHVAIDRYTGTIIAESFEPVNQ